MYDLTSVTGRSQVKRLFEIPGFASLPHDRFAFVGGPTAAFFEVSNVRADYQFSYRRRDGTLFENRDEWKRFADCRLDLKGLRRGRSIERPDSLKT
jgi:hypothetical protein